MYIGHIYGLLKNFNKNTETEKFLIGKIRNPDCLYVCEF